MNAYGRACNDLAAGMIYLRGKQTECRNHACEHGADMPEADGRTWPY